MNTKHYVSLYMAEKLREKGYNEDTETIYNIIGELERVESMFRRRCAANTMLSEYGYISAPTLLEAIDWLEDRDIHLEIRMQHCKVKGDPYKIADDDEYQWKYYYAICKGDDVENPIIACDESDCIIMYTDRNLCWQDAIAKGVSVL